MKIYLIICLASGLASSEKLDRSYLPPPGSKFSGGSPGDIETPLEFPKQSIGQPVNGKPEIELGINRRPAPSGAPDQKPGFNFFQKAYPVPKTTTSYAITQTTTFAPDDEYIGIDQPGGLLNGSTVQSGYPGQNQGPYRQYRPGQSQSIPATYGTTVRPQFPGVFNGPEYLPPVSNNQSPAQVINQDGSRYPSGLPQEPNYQDGQAISVNQPGYVSQQNQFPGSQFPSTAVPQYQDVQRLITPGSNQQNQFTGSQFPSSTVAPQYQGQRLITPGSNQQSQFTGNQFPSSTVAPQYQDGQRLIIPGSSQQNKFPGNPEFPSSTATPQIQFGQQFTTPGLNQQGFGARVPNQRNQFTGNQYQGNQNIPSSTAAPVFGSIEQSQFLGNQNFPSTAAPNYQDGQRFTTPGQIQGAIIPGQPGFAPRVPIQSQNQFTGQSFPTSTSSPQFQDGARLTTPGFVQEGYGSPVSTQQNQNQYPGNQNYPSSPASQYQNGEQFTTSGLTGHQNYPSTPGQYQGQQVLEQQRFGSRIPGQPNQSQSTAVPHYQDSQRFSTPGTRERFDSPDLNQQNQYPGSQNFLTSTTAPQYQDGQRISTPGSAQTFGPPQLNQYSTVAPHYQGQSITTPGQLFNQPIYPGSTAAPQYQQTLAPTPGISQEGVMPSRQDQFQRPVFNQQFPSSTASPQGFIPGSQSQYGDNISTPGGPVYGNNQQPTSQTGASFPSTAVGSLPTRDFASTPGFENIGGRPERPQAEGDRNAEILSYETVLTPEGYFYSYDTSNGIHADETGTVGNGTRAQGGFSYTGDDGKVYSVVYSADENGFQPHGDHLPTPPPIPEAIQRIIDQANKDKESGIEDDGTYNEEKYGYMKYEGPLTRVGPQNKTTSVVDEADIPDKAENRIGEQTKKTSKTKGRRPVSNLGNNEFESDYETETDETDMNGDNRRIDDSQDNKKDNNRRITSKRPKPIKNLTVEGNRSDNLKGTKMTLKPTNSKTGSLQNPKTFERNGSDRRPITSEEYEENTSDDITEESEDNGDLQESQGLDYDSDLVNYKDDPNHRTDFHGLNKYLPESKKSRKNQSGKKQPTIRVKETKQSIEVKEAEIPEDSGLDLVDQSRTRIPSRKNKIRPKGNDLSNVAGQTVRNGDDETDSYDDDRTDTDEEFLSDDETNPVTNDRVRKPGTPQLKKKILGKPKRPNVNERTDMSDDKESKPSTYEDNGYEYTPPQRKFGSEEAIKFPSRANQKGAHTTLRPFMTKNVFGDDTEVDEYNTEYGAKMPSRGRPMTGLNQYPGHSQEGDSYNQNNPEVNEEDGFSTTRRPVSYGTSRPVGRPQTTSDNQNNPEVNKDYGFYTTRRPVSYGTSRPFGRPQTTSESYNENNPEVNEDNGFSTTRRPVSYGIRPFGRPQTTGETYMQNKPQVNEDERFSTTKRPISYGTSRPFGRPQTGSPQYQEQGMNEQVYNSTIQQRPGDKLFYNSNAPTQGTLGNVFSSTTPLPPPGLGYKYPRPGSQTRPTDGSYTSDGETYNTATSNQLPSTTYRPNYSFGSKISSPVTVDGFGRPIQSTTAPAFDRTLRPTYSTSRPSDTDQFRPTEGRFGIIPTQGPTYQSPSAPIGEDFSGPKQPQRFDPQTGYHYK